MPEVKTRESTTSPQLTAQLKQQTKAADAPTETGAKTDAKTRAKLRDRQTSEIPASAFGTSVLPTQTDPRPVTEQDGWTAEISSTWAMLDFPCGKALGERDPLSAL